ncbi:hypothetical protein [Geminicoccus flavidas]|uniref:hypothetical protein n=1 Tax=Geminicoccus flavidas TaxID=2506407 RepID=UPI0013583730|nr:hypothetical protein [Geminicoccus flavidas]
MLNWLSENSDAVNVVLNLAMLLVWIAYLQVFVSSYRRQRQANILISVGGGSGLDARCLISNLSQGAIYIRSLLLDLTTAEGASSHSVTEIEDLEEWQAPTDLNLWTRQGPLDPGCIRDMGTFRAMLDHAIRAGRGPTEQAGIPAIDAIEAIRVTVIAHYGPEDLLVAAEQSYTLNRRDGSTGLSPQAVTPRQIRSRGERKQLRARLEQEVNQGRRTM